MTKAILGIAVFMLILAIPTVANEAGWFQYNPCDEQCVIDAMNEAYTQGFIDGRKESVCKLPDGPRIPRRKTRTSL